MPTNTVYKNNTGKKTALKTSGKKTASAATGEENKEKAKNKKQTPFEKLFEDLLKDIYWAEQQLVTALQEMQEAATTEDLKEAFEDHLHVTRKHVARLEKVFSLIGIKAEAKKCDAMEGLIKEGKHVIEETKAGSMTRDAGLIISAQKIEHYEIAAYGSLVQVALTLGHDRAAQLLEKTLNDEEGADRLLSDIAETEVNPMADDEGEEGTEEAGSSKPEETE